MAGISLHKNPKEMTTEFAEEPERAGCDNTLAVREESAGLSPLAEEPGRAGCDNVRMALKPAICAAEFAEEPGRAGCDNLLIRKSASESEEDLQKNPKEQGVTTHLMLPRY